MSIIQDALKKAQRTGSPIERPARDTVVFKPVKKETVSVKAAGKKPAPDAAGKKELPYKYALAFFASLTVLLVFTAAYFSVLTSSSSKKEAEAPLPAQSPNYAPAPLAIPEKVSTAPRKEFRLAGIMHLEDGPVAIINNSRVAEGDYVNDAVVASITDNTVVLKRRDSEITLHLK
ncbi:MAG: hypothetical protein PHX20_05395 [Candidatus Omnitrophica bacterium]|nr:hypothetical protein [Candidatus Omnitrophota bacterium]